ncbi:OmpA family protein [Cypionkella sp.]|uniref:OmpA/MotB family protein n=1 Tax=Cypionkella sp. TaxID=2811411 RepID=UPI002723A027|nr:OmpA family protein [Cypionkella sp.]MDO8984367.1 OmpA family protein [Cypionkella sp.]MDP2048040.1 OmpA family protein [Cypionkella sp.]
MRGGVIRRRHDEDEEESAFVSMTDMTVGFLFIVILLLAFFASQYDPSTTVPLPVHKSVLAERDALLEQLKALEEKLKLQQTINVALRQELDHTRLIVAELRQKIAQLEAEIAQLKAPDPLETYINRSLAERKRILETLRDSIMLDFPELDVILSEESDALRFQGDGLFRSGSAVLRPDRVVFVRAVASRLEELLPCYTLGPGSRWSDGCNPGHALIEAVQIEGHTDADGQDFSNLVLSTARANDTFHMMTEQEPGLVQHLNFRNQPVLSVAGYGRMRPIKANDTVQDKAANRRIDLRIIMYVPSRSEEIETVRAALNATVAP